MEASSVHRESIAEEKVFRALLLLDFYRIPLSDVEDQFRNILTQPFQSIADWARSLQRGQSFDRIESLWRALDPAEQLLNLHCKVSFTSCTYVMERPTLKPATSYFFGRQFSHSRFLTVTLRELPGNCRSATSDADRWHGPRLLFDSGLVLAGRRYRFLHGKEQKPKDGARLVMYFFAEENTDIMSRLTTSHLSRVSIDDVINTLGRFPNDIRPEKLDARLQLGFSKSFPLALPEAFVFVENDVRGVLAHSPLGESLPSDHIMTDGCGFISASLARAIPYGICSGQVRGQGYTLSGVYSATAPPRPADYPLPALIQVRLVCSHGLFKGCLLVTSDPRLCRPDCVIVRHSMKKADGACYVPPSAHQLDDMCDRIVSLDIVNTFEQADVNSSKIVGEKCYAYLNKFSCLFLQQRNVPVELFMVKLEDELQRVVRMVNSRETAMDMVRKSLSRGSALRGERGITADVEDEDEEEDSHDGIAMPRVGGGRGATETIEDWMTRISSSNVPSERSWSEMAHDFLLAGHSLSEPVLRQCLKHIQEQELSKLERFKLRLSGACNLPGAPDPTGTLLAGEVYVALPVSKCRANRAASTAGSVVSGRVVVMRPPTLHENEIRVLSAVQNKSLARFLEGTSAGIIFFSVQGERSNADEMGTGDFDGDMYSVLFCNNEFVKAVKETRPVDYSAMQPTAVSHLDAGMSSLSMYSSMSLRRVTSPGAVNDLYHLKRFEGLITAAESSLLGMSTNALLAMLDNGGDFSRENLEECFKQTMQLLDAAKSGIDVKCNRELFRVPFPHFMRPQTDDNTYHSRSVLGLMYDKVKQCQVDLARTSESCFFMEGAVQSPSIPHCACKKLCNITYMKDGHRAWACNNKLEGCKYFQRFDEMFSMDNDLMINDLQGCADNYAILRAKWAEHLLSYNNSLADVLSGSRQVVWMVERKLTIARLKTDFRCIFDEDAKFLCSSTAKACGLSSVGVDLDFFMKALALKCRLLLASIVYQVTYELGGKSGKFFCWEICGQELHHLKAETLKRRNGLSPCALLPYVSS